MNKILGMLIAFLGLSTADSYGHQLEKYIVSKSPQDVYDIERLTQEFDRKNNQRFI